MTVNQRGAWCKLNATWLKLYLPLIARISRHADGFVFPFSAPSAPDGPGRDEHEHGRLKRESEHRVNGRVRSQSCHHFRRSGRHLAGWLRRRGRVSSHQRRQVVRYRRTSSNTFTNPLALVKWSLFIGAIPDKVCKFSAVVTPYPAESTRLATTYVSMIDMYVGR